MNWEELKTELSELNEQLVSADLEKRKRAEMQKRATQLQTLVGRHDEIVGLEKELAEARELAKQDEELKDLYEEEIATLQAGITTAQNELEDALYPADERDNRSVYVEIRGGAGGQEAALFAGDLFKMYSNYAQTKYWKVEVVEARETDIGGYKELIIFVKGKNVYKHLKFESGVHRVQRVPATETQGRVHTSTVTVVVLPEVEEVEVSINPSDLRIDVYRSSGPGGQSVNTTDSAVRITHVPTGVVVCCQDERSQIKNKAKAMKILQARIFEAERQRHEAEQSAERKSQVGAGMRSEKIRTYNYPQNRISDHRINLTLKKLDIVMTGQMDYLLEPLMQWEREERRKQKK